MGTYLVGRFFYRIIEAKSPTKAWIIYANEDVNIKQVLWTREDARQELIKRGFNKLQVSDTQDIYEVFK